MPSTEELHRHLGILRRRDKNIARAISKAGLPTSRRMEPGFATLIRIIIDQQVSAASGAAIWNKLCAAANNKVTAQTLLEMGENGLRTCGFSGQKARYSLGVAEAVHLGNLDFESLSAMGDEDVRTTLVKLKGIGPWSADIYLMFGMGRHNIWPVGDLALQYSAQVLLGLRRRPKPEKLETIGESWKPYRSSAALMLWRFWHFHVQEKRTKKPRSGKKPSKHGSTAKKTTTKRKKQTQKKIN